ncbi:MAG: ribosome biogenesis factor YjgA [Pseudomonadota bacterium]
MVKRSRGSDVLESVVEPSKTARKREAERLQNLGRKISELPLEQRDGLQLPDKLRAAIDDYLRFPSREAKRRQLQYVGKVMRDTDIDAIEAQLETLAGESAAARFEFHQVEHWRDRLLADNDELSAYIDDHPHVDRQALRHAIQRARQAKTESLRKQYARELFRFLRQQQEQP